LLCSFIIKLKEEEEEEEEGAKVDAGNWKRK
jgi:hypothetical protein